MPAKRKVMLTNVPTFLTQVILLASVLRSFSEELKKAVTVPCTKTMNSGGTMFGLLSTQRVSGQASLSRARNLVLKASHDSGLLPELPEISREFSSRCPEQPRSWETGRLFKLSTLWETTLALVL